MANNTEHIRIKSIIDGDTKAFALLVDEYKDMAMILAYNILLNREDAEEVAQDAFVKAYSALSSFKGDARFSTWLYRIVLNTALNRKRLKIYPIVEITESINNEFMVDLNHAPVSQETSEQKKMIQRALISLSEKERICITLYYLHELSVEEIHELTGIGISNIKVLLHRGRKNLYAILNRYFKNELTSLR